ncbi:uncharacterized protein LOC121380136 [Gigantopelta aegis]|uniref:uncharacterized protein LOC121380136 n=1 Tax=Gigantopelta aegis TaxID=1735272 RepID=UPI001B88A8C1|nr:uncharacterized protein LOC121380136 [Gigantopelta aegis]
MKEYTMLLTLLMLVSVDSVVSEDVLFPAGTTLPTVDPESIPDGATKYTDPKNTGSYLFDSEANNVEMERLALTILVSHVKSQNDRYFRAHPVLIACAEKVMVDLTNQDKPLMVIRGYQTRTEIGSSQSDQDIYAAAGTAIQLMFRPKVNGDLLSIAQAALNHCPLIFERAERDFGLVMMSDRVHIHMTEADGGGVFLGVDGYTGSEAGNFENWAWQQIDNGLDPEAVDTCTSFTGLPPGGVYPTGSPSPEATVGHVDDPITRNSEDFNNLVQYPGRSVEFENEERTSPWCGDVDTPCQDCRSKPQGNSRSRRCASRLMSPRMFACIRILQKLVRHNLNRKLRIVSAFDEAREGHTPDAASLRTEGRLLTLKLSGTNSGADMNTLSKLARCADIDYVKNDGTRVIVAVRKSVDWNSDKVRFPESSVLIVSAPASKKDIYKLPRYVDEKKHPLIDPDSQEDLELAENTPLGLFKSKDSAYRYLRVQPRLTMCHSALLHKLNKWNPQDVKTIDIVNAYMSAQEEQLKIDAMDQRFGKFSSGEGMEIRLGASDPNTIVDASSLSLLLKTTVDMCGPIFHDAASAVGIGLYKDTVFVCMQDEFDFWTDDQSLIPSEYFLASYKEMLQNRFKLASQHRLIDPDDLDDACSNADPPARQSVHFQHTHSARVVSRGPDECVPSSGSQFCRDTEQIRKNHIEVMAKELARKWWYHDHDELQAAFEKCFSLCGTCMDGEIWDEKVKNCDNFLHWAPFELLNEGEVSNIFPRDNAALRRYASQSGHTIEDSPLFHLVFNTVGTTYRPDPKASVQEELYPQAENPSPVLELLLKMYCINAVGTVKFWVADETDTVSLKEALRAVVVYNKNVTDIEVYVMNEASRDAVEATIENLVAEWSTSSCPLYTREFIAQTTVRSLSHDITKRSVSPSVGEELINEFNSWEYRWANQEL